MSQRIDARLLNTDRHGALRPPATFWWCSVLLMRNWILFIVYAGSWLSGRGGEVTWINLILDWPGLLVEVPMGVLLLAWARREPKAGGTIRWLWRHGRELMTLTIVLGIAWTAWGLAGRSVWEPVPDRLLALVALVEVAIAVGIWRSPLYRALFGEFPPPPSAPAAGGR